MTQNQLKWLELQQNKALTEARDAETARANRANEEITRTRDAGNLDLGFRQLDETKRSNRRREDETERSNRRREDEAERHNRVGEVETERSNRERERETRQHNRNQESIGFQNVNLGYANLAEQSRANRQHEQQNLLNYLADKDYKTRSLQNDKDRIAATNHATDVKKQIADDDRYQKNKEFLWDVSDKNRKWMVDKWKTIAETELAQDRATGQALKNLTGVGESLLKYLIQGGK